MLDSLGFKVKIYLHNYHIGIQIFEDDYGKLSWNHRLDQQSSKINLAPSVAALSLMYVVTRQNT